MKKFTLLLGSLACLCTHTSLAQTTIWSEDFESPTVAPALPTDWTQQTAATTGWKTNTGKVTYGQTGWVCPAHTQFAVVDDWNNNENNHPSILVTPFIDLTSASHPFLQFDYFYVGASYGSSGPTEKASVLASIDSGKTWTELSVMTGDDVNWQKSYINLASYIGKNNLKLGFKYDDGGGGSSNPLITFAIDNPTVFEPVASDISATTVTPAAGTLLAYAAANTNAPIKVTVFNNGYDTIKSFNSNYQVNAGAVVTDNITGVSIAPFTSYTFSFLTPYTMPSTLGDYKFNIWTTATADINNSNDSVSTTITDASFMPSKKILLEEGTGSWCGWCPRGAVYMDSVFHLYPDHVSPIAVHDQDAMSISAYDAFISAKIGGYPNVVIDRREHYDPSTLLDIYDREKDYFGFADITLTPVDAGGFNLSVKATVKPAIDLNGDYRLAMVLTEDNVNHDTSTYDQHNYYSGNIPLTGAGHDWFAEGSIVPGADMFYQFVARGIYPSTGGASSSLPSSMTAGNTYDYTFTENNVAQPFNRANMRYIVMLIRNTDGQVLNSSYATVSASVANVNAGINSLMLFPNPATTTSFVGLNLKESTSVSVDVIDMLGRVVYSVPAQQMTAGNHKVQINTSNLASGNYTVKVQTDKGAVSQQLSVTK